MNIAWFRDRVPDPADPLDDTSALIEALRATHAIDVFVDADAKDFVWRHALTPWDLCVYELDNTRAHQFAWAYLLNYPGIVFLKNRTLHDSRAAALDREDRMDDYRAELRFSDGAGPPMTWKGQHHTARGSWPMLRIPLLASRAVVVPHASVARSLQETYPEARVRCAPSTANFQLPASKESEAQDGCRIGVLDSSRLAVVERAVHRAREAGAVVELMTGESTGHVLAACDVVIALTWPAADAPLTAALAGMAAGKATVTYDLETTTDWASLDPQTWRPRGSATADEPLAVTIDPRDEEHSLMLAIRRLASDAPLRAQLGRAGHAWWQAHATPAHAAAAWNQILEEAASLAPPAKPGDWPAHLNDDGTRLAADILAEFRLGTRLA
jgi:hypothetical protein